MTFKSSHGFNTRYNFRSILGALHAEVIEASIYLQYGILAQGIYFKYKLRIIASHITVVKSNLVNSRNNFELLLVPTY